MILEVTVAQLYKMLWRPNTILIPVIGVSDFILFLATLITFNSIFQFRISGETYQCSSDAGCDDHPDADAVKCNLLLSNIFIYFY